MNLFRTVVRVGGNPASKAWTLDQARNDYFENSLITLLMQAVLRKNYTNSYSHYSLATASRLSADG